MKVKLKNEKKSGCRDGGSAAEAADAWWKPIGVEAAQISRPHHSPLQAVDAHVLTCSKGTLVLVLSVLLNEHDWFLKWFRGSIKRHTVNLIHNHETNTAVPQYRPSMLLPVCCSLAFCALWIILFFSLSTVCSFYPTFPKWRGSWGGWLSMSPSDRRGAAFTLSKRGKPSLLISPRTAQSRVVGGLWKPLLSRWVSTLSPPLNLIPPQVTQPPPSPFTQLNHSQLSKGGGGGGKREGWKAGKWMDEVVAQSTTSATDCHSSEVFFFFPLGTTGPIAPSCELPRSVSRRCASQEQKTNN